MNKTAFDPCIGIAGAGAIVMSCHLPAYTKAGFHIAAIHDRDPLHARELLPERGESLALI